MATALAFLLGVVCSAVIIVAAVAFLAWREKPAEDDLFGTTDDWGGR